jgi:signal transduction histidine kinase
MQLFAAPLLASSNIHSTFEYEPGISKLNLGVEAKQNFYLIFKESVNNVAKHSGATECFISIQYRSAYVFMKIRDNGKGFDEAVLSKGRNGLKNMEERAEQVGGKLKLSTLPGKGTVVSLRMPVA